MYQFCIWPNAKNLHILWLKYLLASNKNEKGGSSGDPGLAQSAGFSWARGDEVGKQLLGKPSIDKSKLYLPISQTFCQNLYPG